VKRQLLARDRSILQNMIPSLPMFASAPHEGLGNVPTRQPFPTTRSPTLKSSQPSTSTAKMAYNDPCGYEWQSSTPSSPAYPLSLPKNTVEVGELMVEGEKRAPHRWSPSPNPESMRRQYHHLIRNLRQTLVENLDIAEYAGMPISRRTFTCFCPPTC